MKRQNQRQDGSVTKPLLQDLLDRDRVNTKTLATELSISQRPLQPAELDQDAGGGYNPDHTYPQI